ncbi:hypothetical protein JW848_09205 [Candidatus Bipolaricaulota bacterium]|nr:hypothetical protein [Candidatus Bipolaricaulota bacterium]
MRTRFVSALLILTSAAMGAFPLAAACVPTVFVPEEYYVIPVGEIEIATSTSIESAKGLGYAILIAEADGLSAWRGDVETDDEEAVLLQEPRLLYVDGNSLLVSVQTTSYGFALRPSENGYELVVTPDETIDVGNALVEILVALSEIGVAPGSISLDGAKTFSANDLKGPPTPEGVALESSLYRLTISPDWFAAATTAAIERIGLRVSVIAEKVAGAPIPEPYRVFVAEETDQLVKLSLPIQDLVPLARSASITYVRLPYQPVVPAP